MKSALFILFGATVLTTAVTYAERNESLANLMKVNFMSAPDCEGRPDFITEIRPEIVGGFENLPQVVLVANNAEYYVESKNPTGNFKIHSFQSFTGPTIKEKSKILCGSQKHIENLRFSLFAPTLIDTTRHKKVGNSLWHFQVLSDKEGFSIWNKRSLAFSDGESLEKALMKFGGNYRIYQLSHDQYEVVVSKDTEGVTQYLSVKYDAVKSL